MNTITKKQILEADKLATLYAGELRQTGWTPSRSACVTSDKILRLEFQNGALNSIVLPMGRLAAWVKLFADDDIFTVEFLPATESEAVSLRLARGGSAVRFKYIVLSADQAGGLNDVPPIRFDDGNHSRMDYQLVPPANVGDLTKQVAAMKAAKAFGKLRAAECQARASLKFIAGEQCRHLETLAAGLAPAIAQARLIVKARRMLRAALKNQTSAIGFLGEHVEAGAQHLTGEHWDHCVKILDAERAQAEFKPRKKAIKDWRGNKTGGTEDVYGPKFEALKTAVSVAKCALRNFILAQFRAEVKTNGLPDFVGCEKMHLGARCATMRPYSRARIAVREYADKKAPFAADYVSKLDARRKAQPAAMAKGAVIIARAINAAGEILAPQIMSADFFAGQLQKAGAIGASVEVLASRNSLYPVGIIAPKVAASEPETSASEPQAAAPVIPPADPNIGRTWNSKWGKQTIIAVETWGGRENYKVETDSPKREVRIYSADSLEETIRRNEYELTPEYAAEMAEQSEISKLRAKRDARQAAAAAKVEIEISEFTGDLSPMIGGKYRAALLMQGIFSGTHSTRKAFIEREVAAGAVIETGLNYRYLKTARDTFWTEDQTTKAGMEYAIYLIAKRINIPEPAAMLAAAVQNIQPLPPMLDDPAAPFVIQGEPAASAVVAASEPETVPPAPDKQTGGNDDEQPAPAPKVTRGKTYAPDWENGGMVPLHSPGLPVGQIVSYEDRANPRKDFAVVGESGDCAQKVVCLEDGHESEIHGARGKITGHWTIEPRILNAEELRTALATAAENKSRLAAEAKTAGEIETARRSAERVELVAKFGGILTVSTAGKCAGGALGAKNLKRELSAAFPGIKFSVKSDRGSSINVNWDLGPTSDEVEKISGKYQQGSFDGMTDCYDHNHANQWPDIFGGAKYVFEHRHIPSELTEKIERSLCALQRVEYAGHWTRDLMGKNDPFDLGSHTHQLLAKTSWPVGAVFERVESTQESAAGFSSMMHAKHGDGWLQDCNLARYSAEELAGIAQMKSDWALHWCRIVFSGGGGGEPPRATVEPEPPTPAQGEPVPTAAGVHLNKEKNGVEIHFAAKPAPEILARLKAAGWRWSGRSVCWYQKHTPENVAFANLIAGGISAAMPPAEPATITVSGGTPPAPQGANESSVTLAPPASGAELIKIGRCQIRLDVLFSETCAEFQATLARLGAVAGLGVLDVFKLWRDYAANNSDMSCIVSEFVERYAAGLGGNLPALRAAIESARLEMEEAEPAQPAHQPRPVPALVEELKQAGQDHEFYPTTDEIIRALCRDIGLCDKEGRSRHGQHSSVLDIGAGNGKVLLAIKEKCGIDDLHAIEKSSLLCAELPAAVMIVGTDFHEQSLLSKNVDMVFCNPPYSEFEAWAEKIIRQSAAEVVYLVLPLRWEKSVRIADAVKFREASKRIVGKFDFEDAEDRRARATVHLLRIDLHKERGEEDDAFSRFFNEEFADLLNKFKASEARPEGEKAEQSRGESDHAFAGLVVGPNYPEAMVNLYNGELAKIHKNYQLVAQLDVALLKEFSIEPAGILKCLKNRLSGLKNDYWMELFSNMGTITNRLTSESRKTLLGRLHKHVQIDFTVTNILEVVLWVIKNANLHIDSQLLATYELMVSKCNVQLYKSNRKTWEDNGWRYGQGETRNSHYALDYRIVTHRIGGIRTGWDSHMGLEERATDFLGDLRTIARNLGFQPADDLLGRLAYDGRKNWRSGGNEEFHYRDKESKSGFSLLFDVKAFKNGNLHLRLNKAFILALNVEHGRLKGWLRSAKEAAEELQDPAAAQYFHGNQMIGNGSPFAMIAN